MSLRKLMTSYTAYNEWAHHQCAAWLAAKPQALLRQEVASSFPSISLTLHHMAQVQQFWVATIIETPLPAFAPLAEVPDLPAVWDSLHRNAAALTRYISGVSEAELMKPVLVESPWFRSEQARYEFVQHVVNHGTYHRGQVATIGRQVGLTDAPMTDYNFFNINK